MSVKKSDSAASSKRKGSKKAASSGNPISARKPRGDTRKPRAPRSPRLSPAAAGHDSDHQEERGDAAAQPVKFFLAREGVAFGPYTPFQLLESVRLGIFERHDLVLAEDGKEWMEISRVLPIDGTPREEPPTTTPPAGEGEAWLEVSELLPLLKAPADRPSPDRRRFKPLTEQQLHAHALLSAPSPAAVFIAELIRGRFAFATIPLVVMILGLLTSAAALKHHEPSGLAAAQARPSPAAPAVRAPARTRRAARERFLVGP